MILLIFTNTYPYDATGEQNFLAEEIPILVRYFDRIILVPQKPQGQLLPLPKGVEVRPDFSRRFTLSRQILAFASSLFLHEVILDFRSRLPRSLSIDNLKKMFFFLSGARLAQKWFIHWLREAGCSPQEVIGYTYWFTEITMGLGWSKLEFPNLRIVSRAHGYDLYEELYKPWPLRPQSISLLDGLFADSDIGTKYLQEKYPQFRDKYVTALLGVPDPRGISKPSSDGVFRIVSCSMINPIKRLGLLCDGIAAAARKRSHQKFEWIHFGGGEERQSLSQYASQKFPPNAVGHFPGYQSRQHLIRFYLENPVDVFANVSSTEGTPVSVMEAISCGIPVMATAVGGNVEIVREKNGWLLSKDPTPDEIADMLLYICDHREEALLKRAGSRELWQERYNAEINFETFAQKLIEIRKR
ncbi:MAG TPA: glycosyltransferase [Anaerolineales bacterium]|nr:glycosyltransferase [Anaerolineales bacterium]